MDVTVDGEQRTITVEQKREAFVEELTDAQLKFLFHAEQEREKMKTSGNKLKQKAGF